MKAISASFGLLGLAFVLSAAEPKLVAQAAGDPPRAPAGLAAKSGGNAAVPLTWEASPGATSYAIFQSNTQNDTQTRQVAANLTNPAYLATRLRNDTTYYFRVKAVGPGGTSAFSSEVSATTLITGQPLPNGIYTLAPRNAPHLRLQSDGLKVTASQKSRPSPAAQQWLLTSINLATYRLSPMAAPTQALAAVGPSPTGETGIQTAVYRQRPAQHWTLTPASGGYRLAPADAPGRALAAGGTTSGSAVVHLPGNDSGAQVWNILPVPKGGPDGRPDPGTAYVPAGYKLVLGEEFDGAAIDLAKWETLAPYSQPHLNDEIECYAPEGVIVQGGVCILRAEETPTTCGEKYPWRSGAITSRATFRHAYYEARIKVPQGAGLWPAFWVTSAKRWPPEWDFFEIQNTVGTLYQYMHPTKGAKLTWVQGILGPDSVFTAGKGMPNSYDGFVIYGAEVTPQGIRLWINGRLTAEWAVSADTIDPMWVNCELAVGGKWAGPPDATTPRPADMVIDYVRVYQSPAVEAEVQARLAALPAATPETPKEH